jgi:hypothetical protein
MDIETLLRESDPVRQAHLPLPSSSGGLSIRSQVVTPRRPGFRLGGAGAIALAVAVIVMVALPGTSPRSQSAAAAVLDRMATLTDHQAASARPGEYYYTELGRQEGVSTGSLVPGGPEVTSYEAETVQTWVAPNGSGRQVSTIDPTPRFFTAAARAAWIAAGRSLRPLFPAPPSTVQLFGAGYAFTNNPIIRVFDISHLPTDTARLTALIVQGRLEVKGSRQTGLKGLGPVSNCETKACVIFERVAILLQGPDIGATPARRAALYKVMARIPGVKLLGSVADPIGDRGTGFELVQHQPAESVSCNRVKGHEPASSTTEEVVIDLKTARLLSTETSSSPRVITRSLARGEAPCGFPGTSLPPGRYPITPIWTVLLHSGVVGSNSALPR